MANILRQNKSEVTIEVTINLDGSILEIEDNIQNACNEVGMLSTQKALEKFDSDGSPIQFGSVKWTTKGLSMQKYQTPFGETMVERHVYQTSKGGKTFCPLEHDARIIRKATPRFAKELSHKYSQTNVKSVCRDLDENHNRKVSRSFVQNIVDWVGSIACAKEQNWDYSTPKIEDAVNSIVISMDGAYILMRDDGWREAMVGVVSLYNPIGERLHSIYVGESPEHGKAKFKQKLKQEVSAIKKLYPDAIYVGIADGAADNWNFLEQHTSLQLLDFYHVTEYLLKVAMAKHPQKTGKAMRQAWMEKTCTELKNISGTVDGLIEEVEILARKTSLSKKVKEDLEKALTYFINHRFMMDYPKHIKKKLPIGSGVTEAACKTLVKQRLCCSGMRWKKRGAQMVLTLRSLVQSGDRWNQFWSKINRYGAKY